MKTKASPADLEFLAAFETCRLSAAEFGHREHLRLAYTCLSLAPLDSAYARIESGLHRLLAHLGAAADKYHTTLTRAWLAAVLHFLQAAEACDSFEEFIGDNPTLLDQRIMETHYTRARLWSEEARVRFVEPDLEPIPTDVR